MDCRTAECFLEDFLDNMLDDATREGFQAHVEACAGCRSSLSLERDLRDALKCLPAAKPDPDFEARVFDNAAAGVRRNNRRIDTSAVLRLAASILLVVAIGLTFNSVWGPGRPELPEAFVALNRPEEIKLVFYSAENLKDVTISLEPPAGIELVGFENQREIAWRTDLEQGKNLLVLPVIAHNPEGGSLIANIRHGSRNKQFGLLLRVQQPDGPGRLESGVAPARYI